LKISVKSKKKKKKGGKKRKKKKKQKKKKKKKKKKRGWKEEEEKQHCMLTAVNGQCMGKDKRTMQDKGKQNIKQRKVKVRRRLS